jgi:hypothetical protein
MPLAGLGVVELPAHASSVLWRGLSVQMSTDVCTTGGIYDVTRSHIIYDVACSKHDGLCRSRVKHSRRRMPL